MMSEFRINVYPPYRGNSPTGGAGVGEGRYTTGAFVALKEDERIPPDDEQRTKFIDELLAKYRLHPETNGIGLKDRNGNAREIQTDPTRVKKEVAA